MIRTSSKNSFHSITSASSDDIGTSIFAQWWSSTEDFFYNLSGKIPMNNLVALVSLLIEIMSIIAISVDPFYNWDIGTKKILLGFSWVRGPVPSSMDYLPGFVLLFALVVIVSLVPLLFAFYVQNSGISAGWVISTLNLIMVIVYRWFYYYLLTILLIPLKCNFDTNTLIYFPQEKCWESPNTIVFSIAIILIILMIFVKSIILLFLLEKFHQLGSICATTNGRFLFLAHLFHTSILILTDVIQSYRILISFMSLILITILLVIQIRYMPFYRFWINLIYGSALACCCGGYIASMVAEITGGHKYSSIAFLGMIPFVLGYVIVACIRNLMFKTYVLSQLDIAEGSSVKHAFKWFSPVDFDAAAQSFSDKELQRKVYAFGYEKHKTSLKMRVAYALYLLQYNPEMRHTLHVLLKPHNSKSIWEGDTRFFYMYCKTKKRELEMTQGRGDKTIIKELGRAKKCFDRIKALMKQIWEIFMDEKVDFSRLPGIISTIQALEDKYEKIIEDILKIDPNHVGTLRANPVFEAEIKRNLYHAETLFSEADIAEDRKEKKSMPKSKKFSHYLNQVVSMMMKRSSIKPEVYTDSSYVVDKCEPTPMVTNLELDEKELKSVKDKDMDTQSTCSHESQALTFLKQSGRNIDDIIESEKLRSSIEKSSVLSTTVLNLALILIVIGGIALLIGAFSNSNGMLQRFTVAGDVINMAVGARSDIVKALNQLRILQVAFSPLANMTKVKIQDPSYYRNTTFEYCTSLRHKCHAMYERAKSGEESWLWRNPEGVQMSVFFEDGSSMEKNYTLFDSCLTYCRLCDKMVSDAYPVSMYESGEILEDVNYKFVIINGVNSLLPGAHNVVDVLFKTEKAYREHFISAAIGIPAAPYFILLLIIPINIWIFCDQRKSFKMLSIVKKSVIANILQDLEKKKNQAEEEEIRVHVNTATILRFSFNMILITIFLSILIGVVSLLGFIASTRFEDQIYEVDMACSVQQSVYKINYFATELAFGIYSYYDNNTLIRLLEEEMELLRKYDDALRSGNDEFHLSASDQDQEFREFYYSKNCEDVTKFECLTYHQQITSYLEEATRLLRNSSVDSDHFTNLKYLVNNVVTKKLDDLIEMFKRRSDSTTKPVQIGIFTWSVFAILVFIVVFIYMFWGIGGLLEREVLRAKKLFLFLPTDTVTKNVAIMNFLTNKKVQVNTALHSSRAIREGTYSRILQTTADAVIEFNSNRKIEFVNPEAEEMFECSAKQLTGTLFEKLFTSDSTEDLLKWISRDVKKKKAFQCEMTAVSKATDDDQSTFPVRVVIAFSEKGETFSLLEKSTTYVAFIRNIMAERKQQELLMEERKKSHELICNILPKSIASEKMGSEDKIIVSSHSEVTMLFADIVGFTALTSKTTPEELITMLNELFSAFDELALQYKLEKIKTIGDCYFVASGVPEYRIGHAEAMLEFAIDMLEIVNLYNKKTGRDLQLRIGINTGSVVAGVIGKQKYCYDLWGDSVNVASRMESTGITGKIQVSRDTYKYLYTKYKFKERELQNVKGKGQMLAYIYEGRKSPRKHQVVDIAKLLNYCEEHIVMKEEEQSKDSPTLAVEREHDDCNEPAQKSEQKDFQKTSV